MTEEIFKQDGYLSEFEAAVTEVDGDLVKLDSTAFYPGGGGQVHDTGEIRGTRVTDVYIKGEDIIHVVPGNDLKVGDMVWCSVDWNRRFDLMLGHTGEHILFNALKRQDPEVSIVKISITPEDKYVIIDREMSWDQIQNAVKFANEVIRDNHGVTRSMISRDDPEMENIRVKLDRIAEDEEISVVEIGDVDIAACCGIHVMETSELISIFVDRVVSAGKEGYAVHFKVGNEAVDAAMDLAYTCLRVVDAAVSKPTDIEKTVVNMKNELESNRKMLKTVVENNIKNLEPEDINGISVYSGSFPSVDRSVLSDAAEKIKTNGGVAMFVSSGDSTSVMLASGTEKVNCKTILGGILEEFGGRGGGKPDFSQGGCPDPNAAEPMLKKLGESVRNALF